VWRNVAPPSGGCQRSVFVRSCQRIVRFAGDKRDDEYTAWKKKTVAQMQKESGNRLEIREIESNLLLQELKFRK
jgi:hypothetical protein